MLVALKTVVIAAGYPLVRLVRQAIKWFAVAIIMHSAVSLAVEQQSSVLIIGDSISAAYGMPLNQGWVQLLATKLTTERAGYQVINASISGETTAGGLARLPAVLERHRPALVVIELGGNDGLRGYPIKTIKHNLGQMIALSRNAGAKVLLVAMQIPPNYGGRYTQAFLHTFAEVAQATKTPISQFFLAGLIGQPGMMQSDGIHPTARGQPKLLANIWPSLQPLLN